MKLLMSHDLTCALGHLSSCTRPYSSDLAVAAVAFTIQLAIETGHDLTQMRALERELIRVAKEETAP